MNFDPAKYCYAILPATPFPGVNVVVVRLETQKMRSFYLVNHTVDSVGLKQLMDSLTDDLMLDYFEKKKKPPKNPDGRKKKEQKDG